MKRIFGYLFIVVAVVLSLAFLGSIPVLIENFKLLREEGDAYDTGLIIGRVIFSFVLMALAFLCWFYGLRWIRRKKNNSPSTLDDSL